MNKLFLILAVITGVTSGMYANEADAQTARESRKIILKWTEHDGSAKEKVFTMRKNQKDSIKGKEGYYLYKMGRSLTFSGVGFMIAGSTMIGLSAFAAVTALYEISWITGTAFSIHYSTFWNMINLGISTGSAYVHMLLGATVFLFALGVTFSLLGLLIFPGLILWGAGAKKLSKTIKPLENEVGFAVRF